MATSLSTSGLPSNAWFLGPIQAYNPNNISIGSAVFAGLTSVTDRSTDRPTNSLRYSVANNRPRCSLKWITFWKFWLIFIVRPEEGKCPFALTSLFALLCMGFWHVNFAVFCFHHERSALLVNFAKFLHPKLIFAVPFLFSVIFGQPFVKRSALCYRTVVCLVCPVLSCLWRWCIVAKRFDGSR